MSKVNKKIGLGSISLLLFTIGILFAVSFAGKPAYGDVILKFLVLKSWSNGSSGLHYTIFYSLIFFIPAFIMSYKFKNNLGATVGKILSSIMIALILISIPSLLI